MNPKKSTQWLKTVGLDAVTIYDNKPYFFYFHPMCSENIFLGLKKEKGYRVSVSCVKRCPDIISQ